MNISKTNISTESPETTEPWNTAGVWSCRAVTGLFYDAINDSATHESVRVLIHFPVSLPS